MTDDITTVTPNRPEQRDAIQYHGWLERDEDVRVDVFTGAGDRAFSAMADIEGFERYRGNFREGRTAFMERRKPKFTGR
ncbi:MAG: hypothetical protein J4O08_09445 [Chloroflexi bacterium]|nr:hypothetical protein [Chloroflexota bacterium]MCI0790724.1 hypothetical protein [Chloroflexota bacterium]MCI0823008.1 hypothetical protein [Chloroflexota bacterium]MCI0869930.1 hypothetical protein [Chloroflexota bacterium]